MDILINIFIIGGALFGLIAAIGVLRMPDLYCRMHAATKAGSFGVALLLVALVIDRPGARTILEGLAILIFFFLTAPIAAQMIGRVGIIRTIQAFGTKLPDMTKPTVED